VSIVVVGYNNWPDLELAIQSALHQSYRLIEVIVVDNASSDATPYEVPRRFGQVVRYIRQHHASCAGGYNRGWHEASGEFIQFLNGDDFLAPNKIEKQVEVFRTAPYSDIVYSDVRCFQSFAGVPQREDFNLKQYDDILAALINSDDEGAMMPLCMLFRRRVLEQVGDWDETLYVEDFDYLLRAAWAGFRFRYCPGIAYFYRVRPGQKSSVSASMLDGAELVYDKMSRLITAYPYHSLIMAQLARLRFARAISPEGLTTSEALAKLALARSTNRDVVSVPRYVIGLIFIIMPKGRWLLKWLRGVRRAMMRIRSLRPSSKVLETN
jgi:GT2 family glycosyltransferase